MALPRPRSGKFRVVSVPAQPSRTTITEHRPNRMSKKKGRGSEPETEDVMVEAVEDSDLQGDPFIRMLNNSNVVVVVVEKLVIDRLCDGYTFIHNEPVCPTMGVRGIPHELCERQRDDPEWEALPRNTPKVSMYKDAARVWLAELLKDKAVYKDREDMDWDLISTLRRKINSPMESQDAEG